MGQITRTNFGLTKTRVLTNAEVIHLPTTAIEVVAAIPGVILVPVLCVAHLVWVADYSNIDANAILSIQVGTTPVIVWTEAGQAGVNNLLAIGENSTSFSELVGAVQVSQSVGLSGFADADVVGQPLTIGIDNGAGGILHDGDPGNSLSVTVFYNAIPV